MTPLTVAASVKFSLPFIKLCSPGSLALSWPSSQCHFLLFSSNHSFQWSFLMTCPNFFSKFHYLGTSSTPTTTAASSSAPVSSIKPSNKCYEGLSIGAETTRAYWMWGAGFEVYVPMEWHIWHQFLPSISAFPYLPLSIS